MPTILINGVDYAADTIYPIKWNTLLDERLDEGRLSLRRVSIPRFPMGAPVTLTFDNEQPIDFIIGADDSEEVPVGYGKYNHELVIIEPTKLLEGITPSTLTFTNTLGRTYTDKQTKAEPVYE